jgi:hypothetical protein
MASKRGKGKFTADRVSQKRIALQRDVLQWAAIQAIYMPAVSMARSTGDFSFQAALPVDSSTSSFVPAASDPAQSAEVDGSGRQAFISATDPTCVLSDIRHLFVR